MDKLQRAVMITNKMVSLEGQANTHSSRAGERGNQGDLMSMNAVK
jgi:hypothetical protein